MLMTLLLYLIWLRRFRQKRLEILSSRSKKAKKEGIAKTAGNRTERNTKKVMDDAVEIRAMKKATADENAIPAAAGQAEAASVIVLKSKDLLHKPMKCRLPRNSRA